MTVDEGRMQITRASMSFVTSTTVPWVGRGKQLHPRERRSSRPPQRLRRVVSRHAGSVVVPVIRYVSEALAAAASW